MSLQFSILLPTFKGRFLKECIDSVRAQTYDNWELVIVNDASPEDIDSIVATYHDPRIRYYKNAHNYGAKRLVEQWNYCLSLAQGKYVICMGDDDRLSPTCLETYAELIQHYPDVTILHGQTDIIDEHGQLIRHTAARPEWESALSMIYHRIYDRRAQFIGDFCYKTEELRGRGGYYNLPYAWGSDDISAIQAADKNGIANTQEVVFEYRDNSASITRQSYTFGKMYATLLKMLWLCKYLREPATDSQDESYRRQLKRKLLYQTCLQWYYLLRHCCNKTNLRHS